jgi:hypothetical protein
MLDLLSNLDPTIIALAVVIAILSFAKLSEDKEMEKDTIATQPKEKKIYDKYYFWDLWDKITTVFMYLFFIGIFFGLAWMIFQCGGNWIDAIVAFAIFVGIQFLMIWKL